MKKNIFSYASALIFFAVLTVSAFVIFLKPDNSYSGTEKRYLTQITDVFKGSFTDGSFQDKLEDYLADQFPLRTEIISDGTGIRLTTEREIGDVYIGSDGFMFTKITGTTEQLQKNIDAVTDFENYCEGAKVSITEMIVPTKSLILKDLLPEGAVEYDQGAVLDSFPWKNKLDLRESFNSCTNTENLYYKTDHHWTTAGAYLAAGEYLKTLELGDYIPQESYSLVSTTFRGTQYASVLYDGAATDTIIKLNGCDHSLVSDGEQKTSVYDETYLATDDQYGYFLGGNAAVAVISGNSESDIKLLIIRDSYANCFAPALADAFSEIHLIDLRYYTEDISAYIKSNGITDCLILYNCDNFLTDANLYKLQGLSSDGSDKTEINSAAGEARLIMDKILAYLSEHGETCLNKIADYTDSSYINSFTNMYGIDVSNVTDGCIALVSPGTVADEVSLLKAADGCKLTVLNALKARIDKRVGDYRAYYPDEVDKIENGVVISAGDYRALLIMDNASDYSEEIKNIIKENTK